MDELIGWLTGSFSTSEQAAVDSYYLDLQLNVVQIWTDSEDSKWLYLETALSSDPESPYRQQIFRLQKTALGFIEISIYTLPDPAPFANAWKIPDTFKKIHPDSLTEKEGCSIFIKQLEDFYNGYTTANTCLSNVRGAKYALTDIEVHKKELYIWERGVDSKNKQIWGPINGGYIFKKMKKDKK